MYKLPRRPSAYTESPSWQPLLFFFFNDTATTEIYTLSLHDALPRSERCIARSARPIPGSALPAPCVRSPLTEWYSPASREWATPAIGTIQEDIPASLNRCGLLALGRLGIQSIGVPDLRLVLCHEVLADRPTESTCEFCPHEARLDMRAMLCHAWGAVESLRLGAAPAPVPADGEVLVAVKAVGINYADAIMVAGKYQTKPPLPFSPAPEAETFAIPHGMSFEEAGAFPVAYISSHVALRWQGRLEPGETLLVLGAAGGVGLTAVEIGKAMGARVIAAASTSEKLAVGQERGADEAINYATEKLTDRVLALTDGKGADVCFDPVGGDLFDSALGSLGWGGRILLIGFVAGVPQIPANRLLVKHRAVLGSSLRYFRWHAPDKLRRSVEELVRWYGEGKLRPLVTHRLPLEQSVEAIRLLTDRKAHGKVVVLV